jgi:crotonobetaine/carnitine-CoA ligase
VNLRQLLEARTREHPDGVAAIVCDRSLTWRELDGVANRAAHAMAARGVEPGHKVAVMLPNCWEFLALWAGVAKLGAVIVPVNVHLRGEGLRYVLQHSEASLLVLDAPLAEVVGQAGLAAIPRLVRGGDLDERLAAAVDTPPPDHRLDPAAIFALLYTSGTTGRSKGVLLSHNAYVNSGRELAELLGVGPRDVIFTPLPLFHVGAQIVAMMPALWSGRPIVVAEGFSARTFWDTVRRHRCTMLHYLGTLLNILYKQPPRPDDADNPARVMFGGGASVDIWEDFQRRFGVLLAEGYGLTETGGIATFNTPATIRVGSIGRAVRYAEIRVVDEHDRPLPPRVRGEIVMRTDRPHVVMEGYYKDPAASATALRGGWLHTGDRGWMNDDGYVYFVDRLKDCIRRRGENISSFEVEQVINTHPQVLESAAVGVPDALGEEEVKVIVVPRPGERIDPLSIVQWAETRMAYFMVPRYVEIRDALPKTETQKVQKAVLREAGPGAAWDREAAGYRLRR